MLENRINENGDRGCHSFIDKHVHRMNVITSTGVSGLIQPTHLHPESSRASTCWCGSNCLLGFGRSALPAAPPEICPMTSSELYFYHHKLESGKPTVHSAQNGNINSLLAVSCGWALAPRFGSGWCIRGGANPISL